MKYGWDKIKIVTDGLKKWDALEALTFDSCWYLLIWKWDNKYWTKWDPLMSDEVPCWQEANCPACQPLIDNITDLPWRPTPCDEWDSILALTNTNKLKVICKSQWEDNDRKVAIGEWDEISWYLKDKLIVCDDDWPLSFTVNETWNFHTYCLWWDPSKAKIKFIDLIDTPNNYSTPWLLISDWDWISYLEPRKCDNSDYSYVVYNKNTEAFTTICDWWLSYASWQFEWWSVQVPMNTEWNRIYATNFNESIAWELTFSWQWHLSCTDDIQIWDWKMLFYITIPWIYVITCNSTLRNKTEAWLQAVRWWLLLQQWVWNDIEWTDFKYDSRWYTKYVNDFYPNQPDPDYIHDPNPWIDERTLELSIMSFNTSHTIVAPEDTSALNPLWIWFRVRCSTYLHDHRTYPWDASSEQLNSITLELTDGSTNRWPKTRITCFRYSRIPESYNVRF